MLNLKNKNLIINYLKELFIFKHLVVKLGALILISLLVFLPAFLIRDHVLKSGKVNFTIFSGFIDGVVVFNRGISFSGLENHPKIAFAIQLIIFIIVFCVFIFNKYLVLDIGFLLISLGGLANIIDRSIVDFFISPTGEIKGYDCTVVDYLSFSFIKNSAIFNIQDSFVVFGSIYSGIYIMVKIITEIIKDKND